MLRTNQIRWYLFVFVLFGVTGALLAQPAATSQLPATPDDYRLGPGDQVQITVFGVEDFDYQVRIGSAGTITLPYLGSVDAAGRTPRQLADDLQVAYTGKIFKDPNVMVTIVDYGATPVYVFGAVKNPGTYQKTSAQLRLIDLLSQAGGVLDTAGEIVTVQRSHGSQGQPEQIDIRLTDLLQRGVLSLNIPIQSGDVVTVPLLEENSDFFYVIGEVMQGGKFPMPGESLFATQAIATAGGPLQTAKLNKGVLVRYQNGERKEIAVNFKKLLLGKQPDIVIQPHDLIFIPGSQFKKIGYGLLGIIPGTIQQTATRGAIVPR